MPTTENQLLKPKIMKPNQDQIEDQLLDALLHEQNRGDREQALADIETTLNHGMDSSRVLISLSPESQTLAAFF